MIDTETVPESVCMPEGREGGVNCGGGEKEDCPKTDSLIIQHDPCHITNLWACMDSQLSCVKELAREVEHTSNTCGAEHVPGHVTHLCASSKMCCV